MKQAGFILKLLILSVGLSILIKYGSRSLSISGTPTNVLTIVFIPSLVMAIALGARYGLGKRL